MTLPPNGVVQLPGTGLPARWLTGGGFRNRYVILRWGRFPMPVRNAVAIACIALLDEAVV